MEGVFFLLFSLLFWGGGTKHFLFPKCITQQSNDRDSSHKLAIRSAVGCPRKHEPSTSAQWTTPGRRANKRGEKSSFWIQQPKFDVILPRTPGIVWSVIMEVFPKEKQEILSLSLSELEGNLRMWKLGRKTFFSLFSLRFFPDVHLLMQAAAAFWKKRISFHHFCWSLNSWIVP